MFNNICKAVHEGAKITMLSAYANIFTDKLLILQPIFDCTTDYY